MKTFAKKCAPVYFLLPKDNGSMYSCDSYLVMVSILVSISPVSMATGVIGHKQGKKVLQHDRI